MQMNDRNITLLKLEKVKKSYGSFLATSDVDLAIEKGEIRALIGPNGAGKTTLMKIISGYYAPDSGDIFFKGQKISGLAPHMICRLGIARSFQVTRVFQRHNLLENIQVVLLSHHRKIYQFFRSAKDMYKEEAMHLLKQVNLSDIADRPAGLLAPGERKRLELAMALANEPTLLLLDEPTAGMTQSEKIPVMEMLQLIVRDFGITALFTEHDMDFVFSIAHKITVIHQGAIIADGEPHDVRTNSNVRAIYLGESNVRS
jgi:branched-chain amino acid transport system ATP-binding protein